ncbi:MAG: FmdB family zinc ribbon protein [Gemmatimonadota bacterium]
MPTYAYECTACGHNFDVISKMSAKPTPRRCPVCGGRANRQITGGAGFLFKGEGFYITDYRSEEYRSREKAEKTDAGGGGDAKAGKPDEAAKPDPPATSSDKPAKKRKKRKKDG